jgi:hypothetical protein
MPTHTAPLQELAGIHLSPIGGPPPFARPTDIEEDQR